ncbi:class E sortase [uncultured Corynebacterium sp.]|uniref:class E sortase n=1 Tax=uncultured Corynebacterium sp. TaxID=159447 RepID=UPI0025CDA313|nr:class E sortase [uncultured Corynebacterium sp.]
MVSRVAGVVGELLITVGVIIALFVFYQLYWTGVSTGQAQAEAADDLRSQWNAGAASQEPAAPADPTEVLDPTIGAVGAGTWGAPGEPVAFLTAPAAGIHDFVAFEGVDLGTLANGPGHYPGTALPGDVGNSSFAAHRDGNGAPFDNIDRLGTCDDIRVETATAVFHYKVLPVDGMAGAGEAFDCVPEGTVVPGVPGRHIVTPDQTEVVSPHGEARMVTFTTCHPQWSNTHRLIVHGVLAGVDAKAVA